MKKKIYIADDTNGGQCHFENIEDAIEFIKINICEFPDTDIEEEPLQATITVKFMTEAEYSALPEYQP